MKAWRVKRRQPYTEIGIRRLACIRCGAVAQFQWTICADENNYRPMCAGCDVKLNKLVLRWARHPQAAGLAAAYADKVAAR